MTSYSGGAAFDHDGKHDREVQRRRRPLRQLPQGRPQPQDAKTSTPTSWKATCRARLCHLGNISYRLGEKVSVEEVKARLGDNNENQETFARFVTHLNDNKVNLEGTPLNFGLKLAINPETESFVNNSAGRRDADSRIPSTLRRASRGTGLKALARSIEQLDQINPSPGSTLPGFFFSPH